MYRDKSAEKKQLFQKDTILYLLTGALSVCLSYLFFTHIIVGGWIPSSSMSPTLQTGDYVISNGTSYWWDSPKRGDIIIFRHDDVADGETLIKRVVGVPGDSMMFIDGRIYLNGELLQEPYLPETTYTYSFKDFEDIPEDCYFVMGDNRMDSEDSRFWADPYVHKEEIRGKMICDIPLHRL